MFGSYLFINFSDVFLPFGVAIGAPISPAATDNLYSFKVKLVIIGGLVTSTSTSEVSLLKPSVDVILAPGAIIIFILFFLALSSVFGYL